MAFRGRNTSTLSMTIFITDCARDCFLIKIDWENLVGKNFENESES